MLYLNMKRFKLCVTLQVLFRCVHNVTFIIMASTYSYFVHRNESLRCLAWSKLLVLHFVRVLLFSFWYLFLSTVLSLLCQFYEVVLSTRFLFQRTLNLITDRKQSVLLLVVCIQVPIIFDSRKKVFNVLLFHSVHAKCFLHRCDLVWLYLKE